VTETGSLTPSDAPFLPTDTPPPPPATRSPNLHDPVPVASDATPFLPEPPRPEPVPVAEAPQFDAKAMVESQRTVTATPAYGQLPTGTDEGRAAAKRLREEANRKRKRRQVKVRLAVLALLLGVAVGGYVVHQQLQDDPPPVG
jgi:hypothetical protein